MVLEKKSEFMLLPSRQQHPSPAVKKKSASKWEVIRAKLERHQLIQINPNKNNKNCGGNEMSKRIGLFILMVVIAVGIFGGCGTQANDSGAATVSTATQATESSTSGDTTSFKTLTLGHNNWGKGAFPLDIHEKESVHAQTVIGNKYTVANNEFKADKVISDIQSQIASGINGLNFFGISKTMFTSQSQLCSDAKIPFVYWANLPETAIFDKVKGSPYFAGAVIANNTLSTESLVKAALDDGCKTVIFVAAAIGDASHDQRIAAFRKAFEAAGGKVLGEAHCADPSEAVQKANDLITTYPDTDAIYASGGDFVSGVLNAIDSRTDLKKTYKIYGTDLSPELAQNLLDGKINALAGEWVQAAIASTLLVNYLDGHPILDTDGKAPVFDNLPMVVLTKDIAQGYIDMMKTGGSPITDEQYKNFCYRYNKDVNYQTYNDFISNFPQIFRDNLAKK